MVEQNLPRVRGIPHGRRDKLSPIDHRAAAKRRVNRLSTEYPLGLAQRTFERTMIAPSFGQQARTQPQLIQQQGGLPRFPSNRNRAFSDAFFDTGGKSRDYALGAISQGGTHNFRQIADFSGKFNHQTLIGDIAAALRVQPHGPVFHQALMGRASRRAGMAQQDFHSGRFAYAI